MTTDSAPEPMDGYFIGEQKYESSKTLISNNNVALVVGISKPHAGADR